MVEHILIIGGGIMGVSTAYYLSQDERFRRGAITVTLVEAHAIAGGASGKAGGFLALDWHGTATASLARLSYALHRELAAALDGAKGYGYRVVTSLNCRARASAAASAPAANPALADSEPVFRPRPPGTGTVETDWLGGAEHVDIVADADTHTTAQVHPAQLTAALFDAAAARGVRYVHGRPRAWTRGAACRTMALDTPGGDALDVPADTVVLAAGPWTARVAADLFGAAVPVTSLPGHSILVRPAGDALPAHAVFASVYGAGDATGAPELFVRPDGLVYVAGENTGAPLPEGAADVEIDPRAIRKLVNAGGVLSQALKDGVVEVEQVCYRPTTAHGTPLVGALSSADDRIYVAAGHGPWGITLGPGTGKVMAELILDGVAKSAEISQLAPSRVMKQTKVYDILPDAQAISKAGNFIRVYFEEKYRDSPLPTG